MAAVRIVDVADEATFSLLPPCADPAFDHRTCDYWEDAERGSKAARPAWLERRPERPAPARPALADNPFAPSPAEGRNPFALKGDAATPFNPFLADGTDEADNPFAPAFREGPKVDPGGPRKLGLLARGLAVFGSYAKVLLVDDVPTAYAQFGPLSAYPRAARLRELYPQLPDAPLPAVITCIATTAEARRAGHARRLVEAVCDDLAGRGFAAVETYPEVGAMADATSAATPGFWERAGFLLAVADARYPVMRRDLG